MKQPQPGTSLNNMRCAAAHIHYTVAVIGILLLLITPTAAQVIPTAGDAPTPVTQLEYTSISDTTLFVRGGVAGLQPVTQFFSLDLRPLVNGTGKPTWTSLSTNHSNIISDYSSQFPMAITSDNTTLLYFSKTIVVTEYNIATNTWSQPKEIIDLQPGRPLPPILPRLHAVTDPISGLVYIPGYGPNRPVLHYVPASSEGFQRVTYDALPANTILEYSLAWNRLQGNMLLFGRLNSSIPILWQMATSGNWTEPSTVGSGPAAYGESCMVSVQGGRKMIVFGGRMETQDPVTDLHILDLTTTPYTWMSGTSASSGRAGMACASAGNYFVAWGGTNGTAFPSEILYYNLATNQWISEDSLNGIPRRTPSNNGLSKSAIAALGGGIAAAVALGVPAVFLILRRRRRRNDKLVTAGSEDAREGQKDGYTTDEKDYSDLKADFASKRAPQWAKDSQDMSLMAMNVYEGLGAPHKYLLNQYNSPQHISPFAAANNNNLSDPYQQQQQDDATWPRSPQDASVSATSPDDDAVKHLALIEAKHQRMMERIQREQEAELSVLQQMLEQKNAEQTSP